MISENMIDGEIKYRQKTKKNLADEMISTKKLSLPSLPGETLMKLLSIISDENGK